MQKKSSRKLKVYSKQRSSDFKPVPELRLTGKWIEALGFQIGDAVEIISGEKSLTKLSKQLIMEIAEIKSRLSILEVLQHYGPRKVTSHFMILKSTRALQKMNMELKSSF